MKQGKKKQPCMSVNSVVISLYLFVMLGVFPLYYKYQYADMGDAKYKMFLYASGICVVVFFLLSLIQVLFVNKGKVKGFQLNTLDKAVVVYYSITLLSFFFSSFKEMGFWGADGWSMGLLSQTLFVCVYFLVAKVWRYQNWAMGLLLVSSAVVFLIGVFHRFDVDILPIYGDLDEYYKVLFLSTMGQSSWYSSFLCTVFPIGLYLFFSSENRKVRLLSGIYSVLAMCTLVTQNTDSAFLSLAAVTLVLLYLCFDKKERSFFVKIRWKRFIEVIILILGSFCFMGICQKVYADRMIPLDSLSLFMSQNVIVWILFLTALLFYGFLCHKGKQKNGKAHTKNRSLLFWILLGILGLGIIGTIVFIVLNTNGYLLERFGYQSSNNYLLFNEQWGNGRGFAWKFAVASFADFSFLQKLIGVGPDCFSAYVKSVPEYLEQMQNFWGDLVLTNAHNEYLTKLYNLGIIGLISYVGMFLIAISIFLKHRKENRLLPAFALCIVSYMVHNVFCYEQVCCSPILYILMGMGSNLIHNLHRKSTY